MRLRLLLAAAVAGVPHGAEACTVSVTGPAFGRYDTLSALPTDGVGQISLDCDLTAAAPTVALSAGNGGGFSPRRMTGGAGRLGYNLYADPARLLVWGDGSAGTRTVILTGGVPSGAGLRFSRTVYGRIPARQNVAAGAYGDAVLVTISF